MPRFLAATLLALVCAVPAAATDLARVPLSPNDLHVLRSHGFDVIDVHRASLPEGGGVPIAADVLLHGDDEATLLGLGFRPEVVRRDYEQWLARRLTKLPISLPAGPPGFGQGSMGGYYTLAEMTALLDGYRAQYPHLVGQKVAIGMSQEGRPIWAVKVSDNPDQAEPEPRALFDALQHAREPMSMHTALWVLDHLVTRYGNDPEITALVDHREVWFVPCVNPDGYVYNQQNAPGGGGLWRKNRRPNPGGCTGVDLNRNWPTAWGVTPGGSSGSSCSDIYRGPAPGSEPEVAALDAFLAAQGFTIGWSMHTAGEWLLYPYGYQSGSPAGFPEYPEYGAEMAAVNGYTLGPCYDTLYPADGSALDHYHAAHGMVAFSPEIGTDFWIPTSEMAPTAMLNLEPALATIRYAGSWLLPLSVDALEFSGDGDGHPEAGEVLELAVTVRNKGQVASGAATVSFTSTAPELNVLAGSAPLGPIPSMSTGSVAPGMLRASVASGTAPGTELAVQVSIAWEGQVASLDATITVGVPRTILRDDLEADLGWSAGVFGDTATTGVWERDDPTAKFDGAMVIQPGDDASPPPGTHCYVTDGAGGLTGSGDVDGGRTTLLTPVFDLSTAVDPRLRYQRFYWTTGNDPFTVELSNDGGQNWHAVETLTQSQNAWTVVDVRVASVLPPTSAMQLRFVALDASSPSVVEALVDELEIIDYGDPPHLGLFGKLAPGKTAELQFAGTGGSPWLLFLSPATGSATLPGVAGTFGLSPAGLLFVGSGTLPADGLLRLPIPVPNLPNLIGATVYVQAIATTPTPALSNTAALTVVAP